MKGLLVQFTLSTILSALVFIIFAYILDMINVTIPIILGIFLGIIIVSFCWALVEELLDYLKNN